MVATTPLDTFRPQSERNLNQKSALILVLPRPYTLCLVEKPCIRWNSRTGILPARRDNGGQSSKRQNLTNKPEYTHTLQRLSKSVNVSSSPHTRHLALAIVPKPEV